MKYFFKYQPPSSKSFKKQQTKQNKNPRNNKQEKNLKNNFNLIFFRHSAWVWIPIWSKLEASQKMHLLRENWKSFMVMVCRLDTKYFYSGCISVIMVSSNLVNNELNFIYRFTFESSKRGFLLVGRKWFRNGRNFQMGQKRCSFGLHRLESRATRRLFLWRRLYRTPGRNGLPLERPVM